MDDLVAEIDRLRPWMYEFDLPNGVKTPIMHPSLAPIHAIRRAMIFDLVAAMGIAAPASVLDLACNEGFFTIEFAKRGSADARGLDIRPDNIAKAELVRRSFGFERCSFAVADVTACDIAERSADIVLLLGIIYHVEDPIRLIRRAAAAARTVLFVETQLTKPAPPLAYGWGPHEEHATGDVFAVLREDQEANARASSGGLSLIPSASAIVTILRDIGFRSIVQLHPNRSIREVQYERVDRAVFAGIW
jgi:SAM-dependent methyltransferase